MNYREKVLDIFPGSIETPDFSGSPSADYCIVRPATKEDWPEIRWVPIGPYVWGTADPWEAAYKKIRTDEAIDKLEDIKDVASILDRVLDYFFLYAKENDNHFKDRLIERIESILETYRG